MLATLNDVLPKARKGNYAVGAYDFVNTESLYGILAAAEETRTPVILQFPDVPGVFDRLEVFAPTILAAAKKATVPVVVHLDHGKSLESCKRCIECGFTSIMIDASTKPYEENVALTRQVVETCKPLGIAVEAEIGHVGEGDSYDLNHYHYTDPDEARRFVEATGVDALAIAIGNAHGQYVSAPKINMDVLTSIEKVVSVPLVMHGGSGISNADFKQAIRHGVAKVNIFTELTLGAAAELQAIPREKLNFFSAMGAIQEGFHKKTLDMIALFETKEG